MNVYIAAEAEYDGHRILGVYLTKEGAQKHVDDNVASGGKSGEVLPFEVETEEPGRVDCQKGEGQVTDPRCQTCFGPTEGGACADPECVNRQIERIVHSALDNAYDNGHFSEGEQLHGATASEIVGDMLAYDADCEKLSALQLLPHIASWFKLHPERRGPST